MLNVLYALCMDEFPLFTSSILSLMVLSVVRPLMKAFILSMFE